MNRISFLNLLRLFTVVALTASNIFVLPAAELLVSPAEVTLDRPEASQQILVWGNSLDDRRIDVTRKATMRIEPADVANVDDRGLIRPLKNGLARLLISVGDQETAVPISVMRMDNPEKISFQREIIPILTKARCNSGGCHGKAEGQNGFKLSIFGFDAPADYDAIVRESRGRRVSVTNPPSSLLIQKASAQIPHGGAQAILPDSDRERRLFRWISEGAQYHLQDVTDRKSSESRSSLESKFCSLAKLSNSESPRSTLWGGVNV